MAILRDMAGQGKSGDTVPIRTCRYCTDYKGQPKPIMPDDLLARQEKDGSYKCGTCIRQDLDTAIIKALPNSGKAREIIKRRQREEAIDRLNLQLYQRSRRTKKW